MAADFPVVARHRGSRQQRRTSRSSFEFLSSAVQHRKVVDIHYRIPISPSERSAWLGLQRTCTAHNIPRAVSVCRGESSCRRFFIFSSRIQQQNWRLFRSVRNGQGQVPVPCQHSGTRRRASLQELEGLVVAFAVEVMGELRVERVGESGFEALDLFGNLF